MQSKVSRRKADAELMYEMRRAGMTNKQISENLGIAVSTVYAYIGRLSESVKHAEVQKKPPVVDAQKTAEIAPVLVENAAAKEEQAHPVAKPILTILSTKYTIQGEICQYVIDTSAKPGEMPESASMVSGLLDAQTIGRFIEELQQVKSMLLKEA